MNEYIFLLIIRYGGGFPIQTLTFLDANFKGFTVFEVNECLRGFYMPTSSPLRVNHVTGVL